MASPTTVYQPTPSQYASAACHLDRRSEWRGVRIDGERYIVLQSGNSGRVYIVRADARGCSCIWSQRMTSPCSHRLSVEMAALEDELMAEQPAPLTPSLRYESLFAGRCSLCHEIHENRGQQLCDRCSDEQVYRERLASKRAASRETVGVGATR